jgi:hypothetical protein
MFRRMLVATALATLVAAPAVAQPHRWSDSSFEEQSQERLRFEERFQERLQRQNDQIINGERNGSLMRWEARRLRRDQDQLLALYNRYRADRWLSAQAGGAG